MAILSELNGLSWEVERLGEAVETLAGCSRMGSAQLHLPRPPAEVLEGGYRAVDQWLGSLASRLEIEIEPLECTYEHLEALLMRAGPLIVQMPGSPASFLLIVRCRKGRLRVIGPDLKQRSVAPERLRAALCEDIEGPVKAEAASLLEAAGVPKRRWSRAIAALLHERLDQSRFIGFWALRIPPQASFWKQLRAAGALGRLMMVVGAHLVQYLLMIGAWWLIGRGALDGRLDQGWVLGWALLLLSTVPFQVLAFWSQGVLLISIGGLLKQRLLAGVLRLEPEEVRGLGIGQVLGRVVEAEAVEQLLLGGGYLTLLAVPEVGLTCLVLSAGAGSWAHSLVFLLWVMLLLGLAWAVYQARGRWTSARLELTHDLVERMVGHRTRLAQARPGRWHDGEDELVHDYLQASARIDRLTPVLSVMAPGWRVVGLLGLAVPFLTGSGTPVGLAVGLGGVILGGQALTRVSEGLQGLIGAAIAWQRVGKVFRAAQRPRLNGAVEGETLSQEARAGGQLVDVRQLSFTYPERSRPALDGVQVEIEVGERLLLTGPSGGGKSTLAALLAGVRQPSAGVVLLGGLDLQTRGTCQWRSMVVAAPQFHENHVLTETMAFNLLMGGRWPAPAADLERAETICRELGLGQLIDRMPSGLLQMVGDHGWQLSHGERSRLFVARALLQDADLVILDESFGALDPESLTAALQCARRHARSLLVIAHP